MLFSDLLLWNDRGEIEAEPETSDNQQMVEHGENINLLWHGNNELNCFHS